MAESTAERATPGFPWSVEGQAPEAASVLVPEQGPLADIDPALFGQAIATVALRAARPGSRSLSWLMRAGSWGEDWISRAAARAGPMIDSPSVGNKKYPALGDGPGEYVRG